MRNCGVRRLPLDFRDQYFGCEIELTGINRATAAQTLADLFGTRAEHSGGGYDAYRVKDLDGKEWKIVRDASIHPEGYGRASTSGEYKVELNSPKLEYAEMEKLQEVVRALRRAGGKVNSSCGICLMPRATSAMRSIITKPCPMPMNPPTTSTPSRKAKTKSSNPALVCRSWFRPQASPPRH